MDSFRFGFMHESDLFNLRMSLHDFERNLRLTFNLNVIFDKSGYVSRWI
ncbi:MAG: hypothetical protein J6S63_10080 [Atopobiaceae bacterium]|nr:hypothetical protein [Atopobiaceae bacterium]